MLKAAGTASGENMTRLMADEPIRFNLTELGTHMPDIEVIIVGGRTETDILYVLADAGLIDRAAAQAAQHAVDTTTD